jgi:translation initiation factor IF-1
MALNEAMVYDAQIIDVLPNGHYKVLVSDANFEVEAYK